MASPPRPRGINSLEIVEHGFDGRVEAVKVHAIKALLCERSLPDRRFQSLSHSMNSAVTAFRHIHAGKRRKSLKAAMASGSSLRPVT